MQKRKAGKTGQPRKRRKSAPRRPRLAPRWLTGWITNLSKMPTRGRFEVLRAYPEVFRHEPGKLLVVEPVTGRMFRPTAWRPAR